MSARRTFRRPSPEPLTRQVCVGLTEAQWKALVKKARAEHVTPQAYIRQLIENQGRP